MKVCPFTLLGCWCWHVFYALSFVSFLSFFKLRSVQSVLSSPMYSLILKHHKVGTSGHLSIHFWNTAIYLFVNNTFLFYLTVSLLSWGEMVAGVVLFDSLFMPCMVKSLHNFNKVMGPDCPIHPNKNVHLQFYTLLLHGIFSQ